MVQYIIHDFLFVAFDKKQPFRINENFNEYKEKREINSTKKQQLRCCKLIVHNQSESLVRQQFFVDRRGRAE